MVRSSLDGFDRPRAERYRRGPNPPQGDYLDSFDLPARVEALRKPLGPGGSRWYQVAVFDFRRDRPAAAPTCLAPAEAVLIVDGVFLLRPELDPHWDYRIFLQVDFETALQRARQGDLALFGTADEVKRHYHRRYLPGQPRAPILRWTTTSRRGRRL